MNDLLLSDLPVDHPLRNTPLIEIGAEYQIRDSKIWAQVTPPYGIAKKTYNQLGAVWTTWDKWRATNEAPQQKGRDEEQTASES